MNVEGIDDPVSVILASVAVGFVSEPQCQPQPTAYKLVAISGPLVVHWPDGRWFEVSVKEIKAP